MSDINLEEQRQEKMASLFTALLGNIIFAGIGWIVMCIGFFGASSWYFNTSFQGVLLAFVGVFIFALPTFRKFVATKSFTALFNMPEYEVVTTSSDGSKVSDHGSESKTINFFIFFIFLGIFFFLSLIIQPIRIIIMLLKYVAHFTKAQEKPPFIKTAFFVLIIGFVFFVLGLVLGFRTYYTGHEKVIAQAAEREGISVEEYKAEMQAEREAGQKAKEDAQSVIIEASKRAATQPVTVIVTSYRAPLYEKRNSDKVIGWVDEGDTLTITGETVRGRRDIILAPVEYAGVKCFIVIDFIALLNSN